MFAARRSLQPSPQGLVAGNPRSKSISATRLVHAAGDLAILDAELAVGRSHVAGAAKRHLGYPLAGDLEATGFRRGAAGFHLSRSALAQNNA